MTSRMTISMGNYVTKDKMATHMTESGEKAKSTALGFIAGQTEVIMKANMWMGRNTEKAG